MGMPPFFTDEQPNSTTYRFEEPITSHGFSDTLEDGWQDRLDQAGLPEPIRDTLSRIISRHRDGMDSIRLSEDLIHVNWIRKSPEKAESVSNIICGFPG